MNSKIRKSTNWDSHLGGTLLSLALLLVLSFAAPAPNRTPHVQPILLQMAAERPDTTVGVIVQKTTRDANVEDLAARLGGTLTKDLSIINAFAVELPARALAELAQANGVRWVSLDAPVRESAVIPTVLTTWATLPSARVTNTFPTASALVDSALGPNGTFACGSNVQGAFTGFDAEVTPGNAITKVEVALRAYTPKLLSAGDDPKFTPFVAGKTGKEVVLNHHAFDAYLGALNTTLIYFDITSSRSPWLWSDFDTLELLIDQSKLSSSDLICYDAIGFRVTSAPGNDPTGGSTPTNLPKEAINTSKLGNVFNQVVRASDVWNEGPAYFQGQGLTVAVIDSGIAKNKDLGGRLIAKVNFNDAYHDSNDRYGHGTFVASVVAGDGNHSDGKYMGIAPKTNIINVRVSDDVGRSTESDVVQGMQWVLQNEKKYNIRVVNLSLNSTLAQSHDTSPMDAAAEILWFNGIVVVVAAGNNGGALGSNGTPLLYPPANDPFVITVGATDDRGTVSLADDVVAGFSAYGKTPEGVAKPDLVAPGTHIIAVLAENNKLTMGATHPANSIDKYYFRMSGTSVSAPIVSGAVALLLQSEPALTPDQVKYRLKATANRNWAGFVSDPWKAGSGLLDIYAAIHTRTTQTYNTGLSPSRLLWSGSAPIAWNSVNWDSVNWDSVNWDSVNWDSVNWDSVNWDSDYWGP